MTIRRQILPLAVVFALLVFRASVASADVLHVCSDVSGASCVETTAVLPDAGALQLSGKTYTDTIPDTLDLSTWAKEYYHGALALMLPSEIFPDSALWVPDGYYAPGWYTLFRKSFVPTGEERLCEELSGPCINNHQPAQWAIWMQSVVRAREMFGNNVASSDANRELLGLRGIFPYDQHYSIYRTPPSPAGATQEKGDVDFSYFYTIMLLGDLYRQHPGNSQLRGMMDEYVRYANASMGTDGTYWFWNNHLFTDYGTGIDGYGGYYNISGIRVHHNALWGAGLSDWFSMTGDQIGFDLGSKAANYLKNYAGGLFWQNPDPSRFTADPPVAFVGHTLSYGTALSALLADARARVTTNPSDPVALQEVAFVKDAYEFAKRRGDMGLLGSFGAVAYLGEMMRIAVTLEQFRQTYPDLIPFSGYYEDVERWLRNQATESRIDAIMAGYIPNTPSSDPRLDRIRERAMGTFVSNATHITDIPFMTFEDNNDGLWLMRGLYDVWKNSVEVTTTGGVKTAWVNILLNNASTYADVYSDIPYRGRVVVDMREDIAGIERLAVRIPSWAGSTITVTEDAGGGSQTIAQGTRWKWADRYIAISNVQPGAIYTITFPMTVQRKTVRQLYTKNDWWFESPYAGTGFPEANIQFGATFLGDVMVQPDWRESGGIPRYQRQSLAALIQGTSVHEIAPPQKTVSRFVFLGTVEPAHPPILALDLPPPLTQERVDIKFNSSDGPVSVKVGDNLRIDWVLQNVSGCQLVQTGPNPVTQNVAVSLSANVVIPSSIVGTTTQTITCNKPGGGTLSDSAVLVVTPAATVSVVDIKFNGSDGPVSRKVGDPQFPVSWISQNVSSCVISQTGPVPVSSVPVPTAFSGLGAPITSAMVGTTVTTVTCSTPSGGTVSDSVTLFVSSDTTSIVDIKFNNSDGPVTLSPGSTLKIDWILQNVSGCQLVQTGPNPVTQAVTAPFSANVPIPSSLVGTTTQTITCNKPGGGTISDSATLVVWATSPSAVSSIDIRFNGSDDPITLHAGDPPIQVAWTSQNVTSCTLSQTGPSPVSGIQVASTFSGTGAAITSAMVGTTVTTITCITPSGGTVTDMATLIVNP